MKLVGVRGQRVPDYLYDASGTSTGAAQLVLAESKQRSFLFIQNISDTIMYVEFGSARATATLSGSSVASCSITNAGFGFTYAPIVEFMGGGYAGNSQYLGLNQPNGLAPSGTFGATPSLARPAQGIAVLSGSTLGSITITDPGAGYIKAPFVFIRNSPLDPYGCATPATPSGIALQPATGGSAALNNSIMFNGSDCPTDAVAIYCGSSSKSFTCKWMD